MLTLTNEGESGVVATATAKLEGSSSVVASSLCRSVVVVVAVVIAVVVVGLFKFKFLCSCLEQ